MSSDRTIDYSTLLGIALTLLSLIAAILYSAYSGAIAFLDGTSFLIVIMGTFFTALACSSWQEMRQIVAILKNTVILQIEEPAQAIRYCLRLSEISYRRGLLMLDNYPELTAHSHFLGQGVMLIVDGVSPDITESYLQQQIATTEERHAQGVLVLQKAAEVAPAMGLIGTLIGLVEMLTHLSDPERIGPAMAVALLTTLYGAVLSYVVLYPLAAKLERNSACEILILRIYTSALVSIARKENPRHLEIALNAMLPAGKRVLYFT